MIAKLSPTRHIRLEKLASYLEYLPEEYMHFNMAHYLGQAKSIDVFGDSVLDDVFGDSILDDASSEAEIAYKGQPDNLFKCGTVACAVGHGPAAGISIPPRYADYAVDWRAYGMDMFLGELKDKSSGCYDDDADLMFDFMFGGDWEVFDNHHWGAAARIRYLLAGKQIPEVPTGSSRKAMMPMYAEYRVTEPGPLPEGALTFSESCCRVPA